MQSKDDHIKYLKKENEELKNNTIPEKYRELYYELEKILDNSCTIDERIKIAKEMNRLLKNSTDSLNFLSTGLLNSSDSLANILDKETAYKIAEELSPYIEQINKKRSGN